MKQEDQIYRGYRKRMVVTAVISSVCYGLMAGGGAAFLTAFLCWLLGFHGVWAAVGVGLGAAVLCGGSLYFFKFRPERYDVLRTIDRMGLEERTVTSAELEGDMSPMAQLQRSDARSCLERVTGEQVKATFRPYTLRKPATVALACCLVFAVGMTTVNGLASAGILPSPDLVAGAEEAQFVAVTYLVEEGGEIVAADGSGPEAMVTDQILSPGEDAEPVVAVAEEGWAFVRWSDGNKLPERQDRNVVSDLTVTAIFEEIGEGEDDDFDGALDDDKDGDYDENAPDATENGGSGSAAANPGANASSATGRRMRARLRFIRRGRARNRRRKTGRGRPPRRCGAAPVRPVPPARRAFAPTAGAAIAARRAPYRRAIRRRPARRASPPPAGRET